MTLNGKVALITGAASGIGYAIAKRYLEADGRVVIADLSLDAAQRAAGSLGGSKSAIPVRMDVVDEEQVNAGVRQAVATFGRIDVLVSNEAPCRRRSGTAPDSDLQAPRRASFPLVAHASIA